MRLGALEEIRIYVGRIRLFSAVDWAVYVCWVGMMVGFVAASTGFLLVGGRAGAVFPPAAWLVPGGAAIFAVAIAIDTIGHRTVYKEVLRGGEAFVHHIIIFAGIGSCVLLCAAYPSRDFYAVPALVLTALSFIYSLVDEVMHWRRYLGGRSDRVEMWSHVFILTGHGIMMIGWWRWYALGYPGVAKGLEALRGTV
jgi:hypothetical protein